MIDCGITTRLAQQQKLNLTRRRTVVDQLAMVDFCSNDYLGLSQDPSVKKALIAGVNRYGVGSGASALISGYHAAHQDLEQAFANFLQRDQAILFNSGYMANLAVLTVFGDQASMIVADKLCHASLIDAMLLSKASHCRYQHNDMTHLNQRLTESKAAHSIIVSEGVFSMEGDIAPLPDLVQQAKQHAALLIIDDAHGLGVLGPNGAGICDQFQCDQNEVDLLVVPLGKAIGCQGAIVAGKALYIEALLQFSRTYTYTTALPPALACAAQASLVVLKASVDRRDRLQDRLQYFHRLAKQRDLHFGGDQSVPIKTVIVGSNEKALELQQHLAQQGFWVAAIRPPTVPVNQARLRITLRCMHTEAQIEKLLDCLVTYVQ